MLKIFFILLFPLFLFSKIQVITYFPLESHLLNKIGQKELSIKEISARYLDTYRQLPHSEVSRLSNAKVYFHFGLPVELEYEKVLKNQNPNLIVVDMSANIEKINQNPYIWTDPLLLRIVAKNIFDALVKMDKYKKDFYQTNYENFLNEIDETFLKVKQKLGKSEIETVYVCDDYWEYFAKRFRIETIKKEEKYLNISEIPELMKFTQDKNIKKILFFDTKDYAKILSLSSNLNLQIIEDDIFNNTWQFNLTNLAQNLTK